MLSLVLCASLIFFAIWHVSVCIFDVLCEKYIAAGWHACVRAGVADASDKTVHHLIKASLAL